MGHPKPRQRASCRVPQTLYPLHSLIGRLYCYKIGIECTTTPEVCQAIGGCPVNVALIGAELWPPDCRGCQDTWANHICHFGDQPAPSSFVTYAHQLPTLNISNSGIARVNTQRRSAFFDNHSLLIAKGRTDKVVSCRAQKRKCGAGRQ